MKIQRHVAVTLLGESRVSTVFLGVDHSVGVGPPVLWETLVFGGKCDGEQRHYSSKADAEQGHNEIVGKVTRAMLPRRPYYDR